MIDTASLLERIWQSYSGEAAWQTVVDLCRYHRIQASPGYRQAAQWLQQRLNREGLTAEILSYPADENTQFWAMQSFQEWHCTAASLRLIEPAGQAQGLADYRADPISVIQRSAAFVGEAEVVSLEDGTEEADYDGLEVAGKVVLSKGDLRRVWELAVKQRGAVGILYDGMRVVPPVRPEGDLSDVRQYTSFWWQPGDVKCFGFVLTPRQGQGLRALLQQGQSQVRIRARVDSRLYDGALEVVSAVIPGRSEQEVVVVAHLCHPRPSANDNASGAAAALEAARTLQSLIAAGELAPPRRTIRFLWLPEMHGLYAYLAGREAELGRIVAGLNLDMVGQDQAQTGSVWLIERPPDAAASFAPDLLAHLRDGLPAVKGMTDAAPTHTGFGAYPLYRQAETPFSGGSDHLILSDPDIGVPTPMLIQWPDRFYHTAADTPDRTDPGSLARAGTVAAAYAYWLASAGPREAAWLGHEMVARFKAHLAKVAQAAVTRALTEDTGQALSCIGADLDRRLAYLLDRQKAALDTLTRLAPQGCPIAGLQAEAEQAARHELVWARGALELQAAALELEGLPILPPPALTPEEQQAAGWKPRRRVRGAIPLDHHLHRRPKEEREAWRRLLKERSGRLHHTLLNLALFWADGQRSVLEIADLVELESGHRDLELLMDYFRLLDRLGLVSL